MIPITKITGRLGNQMFEFAALYSLMKDQGKDWYCQDEQYFKRYERDIRRFFGSNIGFDDRVGVHIRRGDYVNNPFYVDLSKTSYYQEAIRRFPNERFLVFSDDIFWCRGYFTGNRFDFSEGKTEIEDLNLMAACKSQIIANSSFSWWAAWLNPNPNKIIICPKQEYKDGVERRKRPIEWIKI